MKKSEAAINCREKAGRFPEFKCVELEDREFISNFVRQFGLTSCEYSFANLYSWKDVHKRSWTVYRDRLLVLDITNDALFLPVGKRLTTNNLVYLSRELQKHGMIGNITLVPESYIQSQPDLGNHYRIEPQRGQTSLPGPPTGRTGQRRTIQPGGQGDSGLATG